MESGALMYSQEPTTLFFPTPDESSPQANILLL
jgi:hypothetical protein